MTTVYEFAKLSQSAKIEWIKKQALFIECYKTNQEEICVYFLNGFFIEVILIGKEVVGVIPFKRGYKLSVKEDQVKSKILLVDYDTKFIDKLSGILKKHFIVHAVNNGSDALKAVEEENYSAVITNINLNNYLMDGLTIMRSLKQNDKHRRIKVFALTKHVGLHDWYINQGFDELFIKSFVDESVINVIKDKLRTYKVRKSQIN